ncbi:jg169 [Pararge aegeria aegeria]|uniref:Elongation of very long chain fatty acids protein n=1 Tax=Pararge aegeria aegeria TaxID=348720 RepID=A0A8S4QED5_9NEOP|nr:jg169 [Pararge aegeria aegeria]
MLGQIYNAILIFPGGHGSLVGVINSFVHCVMYSYYLLTVAYPAVKQSVTLKKFVTQIQILQFLLCTVHFSTICFKRDCDYPRWTAAVFLPQNMFMLVLFMDFYIKNYVRKPKQKDKKADLEETEESRIIEGDHIIQKRSNINSDMQGSLRHIDNSRRNEKKC